MRAYTIKTDSAGKASLVYGLETSPAIQRKYISECQVKMPAKTQEVVMLSEANGRIKRAVLKQSSKKEK